MFGSEHRSGQASRLSRLVAARGTFAPQDDALDASGHGTAVAGRWSFRVAPGAEPPALDVFRANGLAYDSELLAARSRSGTATPGAVPARQRRVSRTAPMGGRSIRSADSAPHRLHTRRRHGVDSGQVTGLAHAGQYIDGIAYPATRVGRAVALGGAYDAHVEPLPTPSARMRRPRPDRIACFSQGGAPLGIRGPAASISAGGLEWRWHRRSRCRT